MCKLQIQPFATGIGGDHHPSLLSKTVLLLFSLIHLHGTIDGGADKAACFQKLLQHHLCTDKFGKDKQLELIVILFNLQLVNQLD